MSKIQVTTQISHETLRSVSNCPHTSLNLESLPNKNKKRQKAVCFPAKILKARRKSGLFDYDDVVCFIVAQKNEQGKG
jgi:hypothetical protein